MKKILLSMALLMSVTAHLFAQYAGNTTRTERTFNIAPYAVYHRHTAWLRNNEKMIIELQDAHSYDRLKNIDSLLDIVCKDIAFYKDSVNETENVRIDYSLTGNGEETNAVTAFAEMRFTKYPQDGLYLKRHGNISRLKIEQDTVRIVLHQALAMRAKRKYPMYTGVQITFCLNNFTDLQNLVQQHMLQHITDTMAEAIAGKYRQRSMVNYWPFSESTSPHYYKYPSIVNYNDKHPYAKSRFDVNAYVGAGVVRNTLSPTASLGVEYNFNQRRNYVNDVLIGAYVQPYFLFSQRTDKTYDTYTDWFANLEFGATSRADERFVRGTMGIGYLIHPDGYYLKNTTMKAFFNYTFRSGINVSPEVIFTNNFHNIFPGFTVSYYLDTFLD